MSVCGDDAQRKAEGKAWIAAREAKRQGRKHPHDEEESPGSNKARTESEALNDDSDIGHDSNETAGFSETDANKKGNDVLSSLEDGLETTGREGAEAAGV